MTSERKSSEHQASSAPTSPDPQIAKAVSRRDVLALLATFGVPDAAFAAPDTALTNDPVALAPKSYRVVFENDKVRVLEYNNRPGLGPCGRGRHYHPAHLDIFLSEFTGRMTHEDGKVDPPGRPKVGQVKWYEAEIHEVETLDKSATRMIMVEIKDSKWKPSTD